jgi:hypothetical protein
MIWDSQGASHNQGRSIKEPALKNNLGKRLTLTLRHGLQKLIKIREVIQMGEDVEKGWHEKFLSEADLKKFEEIGKNYTSAIGLKAAQGGK